MGSLMNTVILEPVQGILFITLAAYVLAMGLAMTMAGGVAAFVAEIVSIEFGLDNKTGPDIYSSPEKMNDGASDRRSTSDSYNGYGC